MGEDRIKKNKVGCKVQYRGDDYGFTVRFHRYCGEGLGAGVSASVSQVVLYYKKYASACKNE